MTDTNELHLKAMSFAETAENARKSGDSAFALILFKQAMELEQEAALSVSPDKEPTRSILFRSAAALGLECGEHRTSEKLIGAALAGNAPEEIRNELRDLFETINFHRHLEINGVSLRPGEFQLALSGDAVAFGLIPFEEYAPRIQTIETLLIRTAERQRGIPFRERGRPLKTVEQAVPIYLSASRAASFAITMRVGGPVKQTQLFNTDVDIVAEFLECVRLFENENAKKLNERIDDPAYYRNFVQQAKKIAPDGQRIRTVGFTMSYRGRVESIAMRRLQMSEWQFDRRKSGKMVTIVGVLTEAAKKENSNSIGLREDNGTVRRISVPKGLMADIVRPLWDRKVKVTGRARGNVILLGDIDPFEESE